MEIGTRVVIVEDVEREDSVLVGQRGKVVDFKWNKVRGEKNLPVVELDSPLTSDRGNIITTVSGWGLWFRVLSGAE